MIFIKLTIKIMLIYCKVLERFLKDETKPGIEPGSSRLHFLVSI